jgi:hypothetical protein
MERHVSSDGTRQPDLLDFLSEIIRRQDMCELIVEPFRTIYGLPPQFNSSAYYICGSRPKYINESMQPLRVELNIIINESKDVTPSIAKTLIPGEISTGSSFDGVADGMRVVSSKSFK